MVRMMVSSPWPLAMLTLPGSSVRVMVWAGSPRCWRVMTVVRTPFSSEDRKEEVL